MFYFHLPIQSQKAVSMKEETFADNSCSSFEEADQLSLDDIQNFDINEWITDPNPDSVEVKMDADQEQAGVGKVMNDLEKIGDRFSGVKLNPEEIYRPLVTGTEGFLGENIQRKGYLETVNGKEILCMSGIYQRQDEENEILVGTERKMEKEDEEVNGKGLLNVSDMHQKPVEQNNVALEMNVEKEEKEEERSLDIRFEGEEVSRSSKMDAGNDSEENTDSEGEEVSKSGKMVRDADSSSEECIGKSDKEDTGSSAEDCDNMGTSDDEETSDSISDSTSSSSESDDSEEEEESDEKEVLEEGEIKPSKKDKEFKDRDLDELSEEGPSDSKEPVENLPPVPPLNFELLPDQKIQPAGVVTSVLGTSVVVEGIELRGALNEGTILWVTENRLPLGYIDEVFGPVKSPYYLVRFNKLEDMPVYVKEGVEKYCWKGFHKAGT
eukprot:TRINITY_DN11277_c0_g1_i3.p1 TRINITY_DN11277_c0_g1~~TRINITY_DN11277_c0_g1_i3.p1  ORF type:complete len:438 (-),score=110.03 TRINITY_DN11277_c0_g1_i3:1270-2583(-)